MTSGDHDDRNQPDVLDDEAPPEIPDISSDPPPPAEASGDPAADPTLEKRLSPPPKPKGKKRDPARTATAPQTPAARSAPPPKPPKKDGLGDLRAPPLPNIAGDSVPTQRSQSETGAEEAQEALGSMPLPPPRPEQESQPLPPPRPEQESQPLPPPRPEQESQPLPPPRPEQESQPLPPRIEQAPEPEQVVGEEAGLEQASEPEPQQEVAAELESAAPVETAAAEPIEAPPQPLRPLSRPPPPEETNDAGWDDAPAPLPSEPPPRPDQLVTSATALDVDEQGASAEGEPDEATEATGTEQPMASEDEAAPETPAPTGKSPIQVMKIIAVVDGSRSERSPELAEPAEDLAVVDAAELDDAEVLPEEELSDLAKKAPPPPKRKGPAPPPPPSKAERQAAKQRSRMDSAVSQRPQRRPWWEELFGEEYHRSMTRLSDSQVRREATFIEESLGVAPGGVVLDLGCGAGYHAVELAQRGYGVVGYDLSLFQLALAAEVAQERGQKINFLQGDMREMAFEEMFDGIYCWNTSFGYFEEEKNLAVAQRIFKALRPGGMFLLDVTNRDFAVAHQPSQVWYEGDACVCMDDMSVDFITSRLRVKRSMIMDDGRTRECAYSVRLYALHELGKILHDVGFRVTEASGHPATPGVFFGLSSPRIIILAQRP